jgi:dienelactone hydrolase
MARRQASDATLIELFLDMQAAERGAGANTLAAYRNDLDDLSAHLRAAGSGILGASTDDLRGFLASLAERGFKASSLARRLSAVRQLYRFLYAEGKRGDDPAAVLEGPKRARALPKVLSIADVDALLTQARAQAEDAAAALSWVVRNIEKHGGDPNRILLAGHSAGGHLAALLVMNPKYLAAHGLKPDAVKQVAALSGVYDLTGLEGRSQGRVFRQDEASLIDASPLKHVRRGVPPFHITYCQWDYAILPQQAREFDSALRRAGARTELIYVPGENHISEMTSLVKPGDTTAALVVRLIRALENQ